MSIYHLEERQLTLVFRHLERALLRTPLPTERGGTRTARADEFQWMFRDEWGDHFKHSDTRHYVHLLGRQLLFERDAYFDLFNEEMFL